MIAKIIDGKLFMLGSGELDPIHKELGYIKYPKDHFELKDDGTYHEYYNEDGTPDTERAMLETTNNLLNDIEKAIQEYIDKEAKALGYDDIVSACSYAGYPNKYQEEAIALGSFRSSCWNTAYTIQDDVEAGNRTMPTVDEVLAELPKYTPPAQ